MRKIGFILLTFCVTATGLAQKTQSYQPESVLYNRALELYDKEKYNAEIG